MMLYPSMSDLLKKIPNRYSLVNVAAKRARDIAAQAEEENPESPVTAEKPVSIALDDIMSGRIVPVVKKHEEEETDENEADENEAEGTDTEAQAEAE